MGIANIDKNFEIRAVDEQDGITFYDVRQAPFTVYGACDYRNERPFKRLPDAVAEATNEGVTELNRQTAGMRVRFYTDSKRIVLRSVMHTVSHMSHMPMSGAAGFDVYLDNPTLGTSRFHSMCIPDYTMENGFTSEVKFTAEDGRYITVNFPLYAGVSELYIGVEQGATVAEGLPYKNTLPIVYYGSSITQGACASRPGLAFTNIVCQRTGLDYLNLGFSGSARGEDAIVEYMATLPMMAFISDYDYNAPTPEHLKATHCKLYQAVRAAHPTVPYIMLTRCSVDNKYADSILRRRVVEDTYRYAREQGDTNVYYIDGMSLFRGKYEDLTTVEGTHPNDVGMILIADAIEAELKRAFSQPQF